MHISKKSFVEDLVNQNPDVVTFLAERGLRCVVCGEPVWGTLEELAKENGWGVNKIEELVVELKTRFP